MPFGLFNRSASRQVIDRLHGDIVAGVRQPALYRDYGIPDTFEGRFEVLTLLSTLVVRRLTQLPAPGPDLAQDVTDAIFAGLDSSLREMGVGDLAVPKRIKKLAEAFLGRRQAYDEGLRASDEGGLAGALSRNVYGGVCEPESVQVRRLARYVRNTIAALDTVPVEVFQKQGVAIPPAAATEEGEP